MAFTTLVVAVALRGHLLEPSTDSVSLRWDAPEPCPNADTVMTLVRGFVEPDARLHPVRASASVEREGSQWVAELEVDGQRKMLRSDSCDDLAHATALIISIALSPEEAPQKPAPDEVSVAEDEQEKRTPARPEPKPTPTRAPPEDRDETRATSVRFAARLDGAIRAGVVPTLSDTTLSVAAAWTWARVELTGLFATPAGGTSSVVMAGLVGARGCGVPHTSRLEFPLCAGLTMGTIRVANNRIPGGIVRHGFFAGATIDASLVWLFRERWSLWVGPGLIVSARRPRFSASDGVSFHAGPAAIRGAVGIEVRFP